uniref:Uncharacterized protein n=1 Tax=Anguilla anguilla TaxID=7936 RepID=A0A0E9QWN2_ANGAN
MKWTAWGVERQDNMVPNYNPLF